MRWEESQLNEAQKRDRDGLHDAIQSRSEGLGPSTEPDDYGDDEGPVAEPPFFLGDWVCVMSWTDKDGNNFLTKSGSEHMLAHVETGLLQHGLERF